MILMLRRLQTRAGHAQTQLAASLWELLHLLDLPPLEADPVVQLLVESGFCPVLPGQTSPSSLQADLIWLKQRPTPE